VTVLLKEFCTDRRGGVVPLLAIAAIPMLTCVGAGVDYARASAARTAMQGALDSTILALLVKNDKGQPQVSGSPQSIFSALFVRPDVPTPTLEVATSTVADGVSVNLSATSSINAVFMHAFGFSTLPVTAKSSAVATSAGLGCVLSLDPSASGATTLGGSTTVALNNCSLYDNSSDSAALSIGGSASLSALSIGVVGKASLNGANVVTMDGIKTGIGAVADPYADVTFPTFSGCIEHKFSAKTTLTIDPGVYCNGFTVNAGAVLTLNPGVYYLDRGDFSVNGGGTITGENVTLVFTSSTGSNWATASINGNANVNLKPPTFGPTAGIVILGDRRIPAGTVFKFNGGATQYLGGAVYTPTAALSYSGGMGTSTSCTQIIGGTVTFTGNSNIAINCSAYKVRPFSPMTVRLAS
jgi:Flp pilus assembly protein TadG